MKLNLIRITDGYTKDVSYIAISDNIYKSTLDNSLRGTNNKIWQYIGDIEYPYGNLSSETEYKMVFPKGTVLRQIITKFKCDNLTICPSVDNKLGIFTKRLISLMKLVMRRNSKT